MAAGRIRLLVMIWYTTILGDRYPGIFARYFLLFFPEILSEWNDSPATIGHGRHGLPATEPFLMGERLSRRIQVASRRYECDS